MLGQLKWVDRVDSKSAVGRGQVDGLWGGNVLRMRELGFGVEYCGREVWMIGQNADKVGWDLWVGFQ